MRFLVPAPTAEVQRIIAQALFPWAAVGLLTVIAAAVALPMLKVTCPGIPLAAVLAVAAAGTGIYGYMSVCTLLGRQLFSSLKLPSPNIAVEVAAGVVVLSVLTAFPCFARFIVVRALAMIGLGTVTLSCFGTFPYAPSNQAPPPAPSAPATS